MTAIIDDRISLYDSLINFHDPHVGQGLFYAPCMGTDGYLRVSVSRSKIEGGWIWPFH